jgi:hypothetical protein
MNARADKWWIENARVIRSQNHRPFQGHALRIVNAPSAIKLEQESEDAPGGEVDWVHDVRSQTQFPSPLTLSPSDGEREKRRAIAMAIIKSHCSDIGVIWILHPAVRLFQQAAF